MGIYEELQARGLIAQVTDEEKVRNLVNGKRLLAMILLLVSTGLVVCILYYGKSISPTETMKHFFDNISAIYLQQQNNYAGLIFTVLYGLIYLFAGYVGAIIVTIVFIICSLVLLFYDTNKVGLGLDKQYRIG